MKIGFKIDGNNIEGEFTGLKDYTFQTTNEYVCQHFPDGRVFWGRIYINPLTEDESKIHNRVAYFSELLIEIQQKLNDQDFEGLKKSCELFNLETSLTNVSYIIGPEQSDRNKYNNFYTKFLLQDADINLYTPVDEEVAFYEADTTDVATPKLKQLFTKFHY